MMQIVKIIHKVLKRRGKLHNFWRRKNPLDWTILDLDLIQHNGESKETPIRSQTLKQFHFTKPASMLKTLR